MCHVDQIPRLHCCTSRYLRRISISKSFVECVIFLQYISPKPPSSRNSVGEIPKPLSSTIHPPRGKSTVTSILVAPASREFFRSSTTTPEREIIAVDDL